MNERLEDIIKDLPYSIRHEGNVEALIEFAKGQAEQVRKLEVRVQELIEGINFNNEEYGKVEVENERYREFLEDMYNHAYGLQLYPHAVDEIKKLLEETEDA